MSELYSYFLIFSAVAYALKKSGLALGIFCLMLTSILVDFSLLVLIKSGERVGVHSYQVINKKNWEFWDCLFKFNYFHNFIIYRGLVCTRII